MLGSSISTEKLEVEVEAKFGTKYFRTKYSSKSWSIIKGTEKDVDSGGTRLASRLVHIGSTINGLGISVLGERGSKDCSIVAGWV